MSSDALKAHYPSFNTHTAAARDRFENACLLLEEYIGQLKRENAALQEENSRLRAASVEALQTIDQVIADVKSVLKE